MTSNTLHRISIALFAVTVLLVSSLPAQPTNAQAHFPLATPAHYGGPSPKAIRQADAISPANPPSTDLPVSTVRHTPVLVGQPDSSTVKAVLLRSWGSCNSTPLLWDQLASSWSLYGTTPITIDNY